MSEAINENPVDRDKFVKAMAGQTDDAGRLAALKANGLDE